MSTMTNKKKIAADLQSALSGQSPLSIDLYVEVLADYEDELKASLDKDADDALLCMLADDGDVAMMVIDWDGSIYRNENALKKLQAMWRHSFDTNVQIHRPGPNCFLMPTGAPGRCGRFVACHPGGWQRL
jgi:hypothetical protein